MTAVKTACRAIYRHALVLSVALAIWISTTGMALAARMKEDEPAPPEKSYVLPYIVVIFFISLGLMGVFRPSRRSIEPNIKPEEN